MYNADNTILENMIIENRNHFVKALKVVALSLNHPISETALYVIYDGHYYKSEHQEKPLNDAFIKQFSEVELTEFVERNAQEFEQIAESHGIVSDCNDPNNVNNEVFYFDVLDVAKNNNIPIEGKILVGGYESRAKNVVIVMRDVANS